MLNNNYQNILIKFGLWLGLGIATILIGISNVFAETINVGDMSNKTQVLADVSNSSGSPITLSRNNNYSNSIYQLWFNVDNQSITANTLYQFEIYTPDGKLSSNINWVGIQAENEVCDFVALLGLNGDYPKVYFKCRQNHTDGFSILMNSTTTSTITTNNFRWSYTYLRYFTDEENDIDWSAVTSNANQNANNIINNNNQNTQNIINNQNQNTQEQIESQKVCNSKDIDKTNVTINNSRLNENGFIQGGYTNYGVTDYIEYEKLELVNRWNNDFTYICFYNSEKSLISCSSNNSFSTGNINIENSKYFRATININLNVPTFRIYNCQNGNQALNDSINDLDNTLKDDSPIDMSTLGDTVGWLPPGPIDSIINLPLNFFNNLLTALNGTCQPINIPLPYVDKNLPIPCISTIFNQIDGLPGFWNWVGAITSVVILYRYLLALYKYYDDLTTLKANFISDFGGEP